MRELQGLIFDVDGTLAETERDGHRVAFNRAFVEMGLNWQWSESLYGKLLHVSGGKERLRYYLQHYQPQFQPTGDLDQFVAAVHKTKTRYFKTLVVQGAIPLRPGVKRLLQEAKMAQMRCAIATTSALPNVLALLSETLGKESLAWFEVIAAGDMVPAKKPAPDIYAYVLEKMQLDPSKCLVFEDSQHGLAAARQVGLPTLVTVNGYTQTQDFQGAALVLNHLGEPNQPFQVLAGEARGRTYVNLDFLRELTQNEQREDK
jgi:HAD superfamily hydrolase (TIGR01509 family)